MATAAGQGTGGLDAAGRARLMRLATYASVATAGFLILAKLGAWLATGSVSVLASLVDSTLDATASLINLFAVRWALMPPDAEHRFGHGKAESLAALGQAAFVGGSAVFLFLQALDRLISPRPVEETTVGLVVIGVAILATLALLAFQRHVVRATGSAAIRADALHYATDLATNGITIAALVLTAAGWPLADPLLGLVIGAYILHSAVRIGLEAVDLLMDRELPEEERARITALAAEVPGVLGVHGLRTRRSGQAVFIQLHLALADDLSLFDAHRLGLEVEGRLREACPGADVLIHQDPASLGEEPHDAPWEGR